MFICEECYKKYDSEGLWMPTSYGRCEMCLKETECTDRKMSKKKPQADDLKKVIEPIVNAGLIRVRCDAKIEVYDELMDRAVNSLGDKYDGMSNTSIIEYCKEHIKVCRLVRERAKEDN